MLGDMDRCDLGMIEFSFLVFTSGVFHLAMERYDLGLPSNGIIHS